MPVVIEVVAAVHSQSLHVGLCKLIPPASCSSHLVRLCSSATAVGVHYTAAVFILVYIFNVPKQQCNDQAIS
jgi:hypothetical protein